MISHRIKALAIVGLTAVSLANGQRIDTLSPDVRKFVRVSTPKAILEHVEIIDGTGKAPGKDQNIAIDGGKIGAITPGADVAPSDGVTVIDLRGYAVMPGIVGMHDHLYAFVFPNLRGDFSFDRPAITLEMTFSGPRLFLANGVTTIRTTGTYDPYAELKLKADIESGVTPGPHMDVTGPYLSVLKGPDDARQTVAFWADRGVTSFKAYKYITRESLAAAIQEAHKRGLKVTGHLCSVTYPEAIEAGIDNLEHGFFENGALDPSKKPDVCSEDAGDYTLQHMTQADADRLIAMLISRHVAITSTLVSTAASVDRASSARAGVFDAMSPSMREEYLYWRNRTPSARNAAFFLHKDMELERAFVAAGGLLLAGPDPVGIAGNIPGFGDQRQIELLVDAGFSPVEAIRIATLNGATFLGRQDQIGSIAVGKNADLVVIKGDPAARIAYVENVEIVFKDGVGYDTRKLLDSVKGHYGEY